jgi:hypothetical protein
LLLCCCPQLIHTRRIDHLVIKVRCRARYLDVKCSSNTII